MSFETMSEYVEYCKEHGTTIAYVTTLEGVENPAGVSTPLLCLCYTVEEFQIEDTVIIYRVGALEARGFTCQYMQMGGFVPTVYFVGNRYQLTNISFRQYNSFSDQNMAVKTVFGDVTVTGINVDFDAIPGYYLDEYIDSPTEQVVLKSYNGKTTVTVTKLETLSENGYDYALTTTKNK